MVHSKKLMCTCGKCTCNLTKQYEDVLETAKTMRFLMGLNDNFSQVRNSITNTDPLPSLAKTYASVLRAEKQAGIAANKQAPVMETSAFLAKGVKKGPTSSGNNDRGGKGASSYGQVGRYCEKCNMTNHDTKYCKAHIVCEYCNNK
ncbi:hypothetical protein ACLB2K_032454 [Fragaria x ananassa]